MDYSVAAGTTQPRLPLKVRRGDFRFGVLICYEDSDAPLARGYFEGDRWTPVGNPKRRSASLLFVPIWHGATYAGAMSVQSYEPNSYDEADAERLVVVADYIGLAIRHTRRVEGDGRPRRA